jgi:methionine sulfoxide reductase heme-binding subunit
VAGVTVSSVARATAASVWADPRLTWFLTRSLGVVLLVLLTVVTVLGTVLAGRPASGRLPGFVVADLHRRLTVLALVLLVGHVAASVADSYVTITWLDAVVPFVTTYRPLWTGLGTLACDVLLLVAVTSALRHRMSARAWRAAHLSAYAMWPLAVLHTLGDGSDARSAWLPLLSLACVLAVVAAGWWRLQRVEAFSGRVRLATVVAVPSALVVLIAWAWLGPLASGWAQRAGTPPPPGDGQPAVAVDAGTTP